MRFLLGTAIRHEHHDAENNDEVSREHFKIINKIDSVSIKRRENRYAETRLRYIVVLTNKSLLGIRIIEAKCFSLPFLPTFNNVNTPRLRVVLFSWQSYRHIVAGHP